MPIPKQSPQERYADDLKALEREADTLELQFYEPCPVNKQLFAITPQEHGILVGVGYSLGPDDGSVNGYAHVMFSRLPNPDMYAVTQANNNSMWNRFCYGKGDQGFEQLLHPAYLRKQEPFYIHLVGNFPAGVNVLGNFTLYLMPTNR